MSTLIDEDQDNQYESDRLQQLGLHPGASTHARLRPLKNALDSQSRLFSVWVESFLISMPEPGFPLFPDKKTPAEAG
jgi:hypothetical protein